MDLLRWIRAKDDELLPKVDGIVTIMIAVGVEDEVARPTMKMMTAVHHEVQAQVVDDKDLRRCRAMNSDE